MMILLFKRRLLALDTEYNEVGYKSYILVKGKALFCNKWVDIQKRSCIALGYQLILVQTIAVQLLLNNYSPKAR